MLKYFLYIITIFSIISCAKLEYENYKFGHNQLKEYHGEYKGGGSGKWRSDSNFHLYLWTYGLSVYLGSLLGIIFGIIALFSIKIKRDKILVILSVLFLLLILIIYQSQGVWNAAWENG